MEAKAVVFDIGGVLVRICNTWQLAARSAGVAVDLAPEPPLGLDAIPAFQQYQAGQLDETAAMVALGERLGVSPEDALRVLNGILVEPYPGALELVREVNSLGIRTGVLSNTNAPHWSCLTNPEKFRPVCETEMRMASHLVGLEKPDPAIYRRYEQEFGLASDAIVFFDDSVTNVQSARTVGWHAHRIDPTGDPVLQMRPILVAEGVMPTP